MLRILPSLEVRTLSYDPFSTIIILSRPCAFAASSAIGLTLVPAIKPVIGLPSFRAAVTALNEFLFNCPSLCSRIASVLSSRASADCRACNSRVGRIWLLVCLRSEARVDNIASAFPCGTSHKMFRKRMLGGISRVLSPGRDLGARHPPLSEPLDRRPDLPSNAKVIDVTC